MVDAASSEEESASTRGNNKKAIHAEIVLTAGSLPGPLDKSCSVLPPEELAAGQDTGLGAEDDTYIIHALDEQSPAED